jgi:oxygen-dependent protoporphyrinogen oxidase
LTAALAAHLGQDLRLGARACSVEKAPDTYRVAVEERGQTQTLEARAVVMALPAHVATSVLGRLDGQIAETLAQIPYVPVTLVHLGYPISALSRAG